MSEFDPYHKWLGIAPHDQPPNYYRLLGLSPFEADADVIDAASSKQMVFLRSCATGPHAGLSQKLLNEVAAARLCLLNPEKKNAYDEKLKVERKSAETKSEAAQKRNATTTAIATGKRPQWLMPAASVLFLLVAMCGIMLFRSRAPNPAKSLVVDEANVAAAMATPVTSQTIKEHAQDKPATPASIPLKLETSQKKAPNPKQVEIASTEKTPPTSKVDDPADQSLKLDNSASVAMTSESETTLAPVLAAVPSLEDQANAERLIKDVFKSDYAKAKRLTDKQDLAQKLLQKGIDTHDDPTGRFVLLREALNLAAESGDIGIILNAVESLGESHKIDALELKTGALTKAVKALRPAKMFAPHAASVSALLAEAVATDRFDVANQLCPVVLALARKTTSGDVVKAATLRVNEVEFLQKAFEDVEKARKALNDTPNDPNDNLVVGRYLCFLKGDWNSGLPFLMKSGDPVLKAVAEKDQAQPTEADLRMALGDSWWDAAEKETSLARENLLLRSKYWYVQALAELKGLARDKIDMRLVEIAKLTENAALVAGSIAATKGAKAPAEVKPYRPAFVPKDAVYWNKKWYWFSAEKATYEEAFKVAAGHKGHLVTIDFDLENSFVSQNMKGPTWIGMLRINGIWLNCLGVRQSYFKWDSNQPSSVPGEIYAAIQGNLLWHDYLPDRLFYCVEWER